MPFDFILITWDIYQSTEHTSRKKKKNKQLNKFVFCASYVSVLCPVPNLGFFSSPKNASLKWFLSRCKWLISSGAILPSLICYTLETGVLMLEIYTSLNHAHCGTHFRCVSMSTLTCLVHGRVMFLWSPLPLASCDEFWKRSVSVLLPIQDTLGWGKIPPKSLLG